MTRNPTARTRVRCVINLQFYKNLKTLNPLDITAYLSRKPVTRPSLVFRILRILSSKLSLDARLELADDIDRPFSLSLMLRRRLFRFVSLKLFFKSLANSGENFVTSNKTNHTETRALRVRLIKQISAGIK